MSNDIYSLAEYLINMARKRELTIATAESCTGGGIGAALTAISGASDVFEGGIIAYANAAKINLLSVPAKTIGIHGAVSEQTAMAMADGARKTLNTDLAVSVTGIAEPTGGTFDKPVGTVWIGLAQKARATRAEHYLFTNKTRESVRRETVIAALELLKKTIDRANS